MRFMMIVRADRDTEAGKMPITELLAAMTKFNEEMVNAGVMQSGEGLQPSAKGARVSFSASGPQVTDGPFPVNELIAGFWMIEAKSRDEAIGWARRAPFEQGGVIEIRQVFEAADFGAEFTPELREAEERMRGKIAERK